MKKTIFLTIVCWVFTGLSASAQPIPSTSSEAERVNQERTRQWESNRRNQIDSLRQQQNQRTGRNTLGMMRQLGDVSIYEPFEGSKAEAEAKMKEAKVLALAEIEELNNRFRAPQKYLSKYPEYINSKKGGIFRLFPEKGCGKGNIVDVVELERCSEFPQISGFGSKASFRLSTIPPYAITNVGFLFTFPDIYFTENNLVFGNEFMEIPATEIGDLDLKAVDSKLESINFLKKWKTSKHLANVTLNKLLLKKGIKKGAYIYSSNIPMKLNYVYAFRSIAYYQKYQDYWNTDLLIAFKVVGQEEDGSIIIIWKQLQKKDAPAIKR